MKRQLFYATLGVEHVRLHFPGRVTPSGGGCIEIVADSREDANKAMMDEYGSRWAFMYMSLDAVHPADRFILKTIGAPANAQREPRAYLPPDWTAERRVDAPNASLPWELKCAGGHAGWFATVADAIKRARSVEGLE